MAAALVDVLLKTIDPDTAAQNAAREFLAQAAAQDFAGFVRELSGILRRADCPSHVRQAAGLQLKNALTAKDEATKNENLRRWLALPADTRQLVKANVMSSLGTEQFRPSIAAMCVAAIACAELPSQMWPDVINTCMANVTNPASTESVKESSLETLGYICQDIDAKVLEQQANEILTAIVHGMRREEPSTHVRLAATNALLNSLEFTANNFHNEPERHIIMQVVCETTQCQETHVAVAALQCLVRIMSLYYQLMRTYMASALFPITLAAMKSEEPEIALQGIEFWSNVCEEEITLQMEFEEAQENGRVPEQTSQHYAKGAVSHLCTILLETLAKQDESDAEDDWTPAKAAGVCLMLLAQCVGDAIIPSVLPFFAHFSSSNWRYREAAIMAFGSILDGPDRQKLIPLAEQAMPALVNMLTNDPQLAVRDTAAWCIGRVGDACETVITRPEVLAQLLPAMSQALQQEPRVAVNVCWAIVSLVQAAYELATTEGTNSQGQPDTYVLSSVFEPMVTELIKTSERPDANQSNLRLSAFETLMQLIKNSPTDCYPVVQNTTLVMLRKLEQLLNMEGSVGASERNQVLDLQALLCATLQSVLRKLRAEDAPQVGDAILNGLLQIMARSGNSRVGNVMEEALMALSTLVEVLGPQFTRCMEAVLPHVVRGLTSVEELGVVNAAIGVVADMCRALERAIEPVLDQIVALLIQLVQNPKVTGDARISTLSAFGDVALAIGPDFERYAPAVMMILQQSASQAVVTRPDDYDEVEHVDRVREAILQSYTAIVQGMKPLDGSKPSPTLTQYVSGILEMLHSCCDLPDSSDSLVAAVAGLVGDLIGLFGADIVPYLDANKVTNLLNRGRRSRQAKTKTVSTWATKELRRVGNQQGTGIAAAH